MNSFLSSRMFGIQSPPVWLGTSWPLHMTDDGFALEPTPGSTRSTRTGLSRTRRAVGLPDDSTLRDDHVPWWHAIVSLFSSFLFFVRPSSVVAIKETKSLAVVGPGNCAERRYTSSFPSAPPRCSLLRIPEYRPFLTAYRYQLHGLPLSA